MIRLVICLLFALVPSSSPEQAQLHRTGLSDDTPAAAPRKTAPPPQAGAQQDISCPVTVSLTRDVKYGEHAANVVAVASAHTRPPNKRPVLVFIADDSVSEGQNIVSGNPAAAKAICLAADRGLVAFHVRYRNSRTGTWPESMKDIAAAIAWISDNADLFGGNVSEIIPIGYGSGASYLADFLSNKSYRVIKNDVAGAVLISGTYADGKDDGGKVSRGLIEIGVPIVLAWSPADEPKLADEGEQLKSRLCSAGQCPRTAVLDAPANPTSVFNVDGASSILHDRLRQLIGQLDSRGLP